MAKSSFEVRLDDSLNSLTLSLCTLSKLLRKRFLLLANYFAKQTDKEAKVLKQIITVVKAKSRPKFVSNGLKRGAERRGKGARLSRRLSNSQAVFVCLAITQALPGTRAYLPFPFALDTVFIFISISFLFLFLFLFLFCLGKGK